jgi:ABC-type transporter MlaC component
MAAVDPNLHPLRREAEQALKRVKPNRILITFLEITVDVTQSPPQATADVVVRVAGNVIEIGTSAKILAEFSVLLHKKDGTWLIRDVEADRTRTSDG